MVCLCGHSIAECLREDWDFEVLHSDYAPYCGGQVACLFWPPKALVAGSRATYAVVSQRGCCGAIRFGE